MPDTLDPELFLDDLAHEIRRDFIRTVRPTTRCPPWSQSTR
jgi:hypothetical protein